MNPMAVGAEQQNAVNAPPTKRQRIVECPGVQSEEKSYSFNNKDVEMGGDESNGKANGNGNPAGEDRKGEKLDHNLYSRQIYALGESAMQHLRNSTVLISGIGGVGVEIAKNLILGGVRHVAIHDTKAANWHDLSAQYYLTEEDLGKNRAEASFKRLEELNDSVECGLHTEPLTEEFVGQFDLTILTDAPHSHQLEVNAWTRKHGKQLITADARGLFSYIFVDLGEQFRIDDPNGEQCREVIIEHVNGETGDVFTLESVMHGFEDGDYVTFSEIKGMTELNGIAPLPVKVIKPNVFNIGDAARTFNQYVEGGRCRQVKVPKVIKFASLEEQLKQPELLVWDFAKFEAPAQSHALWQALYKFEEKHKRAPAPRSVEDAALLKALLPEGTDEIPEEVIRMFSFQATGNLQPVTSVVGGITAQEAMKAVTHHTTPLQQFLYADSREALPGAWSDFDNDKLTAEDCKPRNNRYDGQAAVFGWPFQQALLEQKWFIVGAGAIGCELLKNLAMIGLGCDPNGKGKIKITDMDQIEISNLNRQFLFRRHDVGGKKSEVAGRAVKHFNSGINIEALSERVAEDTEHVFTDDFFAELNGVANALDNVEARRYMDRRCVYYQLPLLESGTMGPKGNTQVVYPHLTESYSSSNDPPEKDIPICTLKNFPYEISHTIQWARDLFEKLFTTPAETVNQYLSDERGFLERLNGMNSGQRIEILRSLKQALIDDRPSSPEECVKWARELFQSFYHNQIAQLLHNFPADQVTDQGVKFWSGTKRCPHTLNFDPSDQFHFNFVYAASILRAQQYNLEPIVAHPDIVRIIKSYTPKPFSPKSGVRIAVTDAEAANEEQGGDGDESENLIDELKLSLARLNLRGTKKLVPVDFEKDDDTNHHVEFITAASNLRAENYDIPPADMLKTKQIAGRIIPALATTTATVAGLVCIELYKTVDAPGRRSVPPLDRFKNGFINMALPFFAFSEPIAAPKKKYANGEFTLWDRLEISGPKTLKEVLDWVQTETGHPVSMMSSGVSLLYAFFQPEAKKRERLGKNVEEVVEEVSRKSIPAYRRAIVFEVIASDDQDEDVEVPYIKYNITG